MEDNVDGTESDDVIVPMGGIVTEKGQNLLSSCYAGPVGGRSPGITSYSNET
jgi:hypothetical protein